MCDRPHYEDLEARVDGLDNRLTAVETTAAATRHQRRQGSPDAPAQLRTIYEERAEWGKWARANLGLAFKWVGIIVLGACGINQASNIIQTLARCFGMNL